MWGFFSLSPESLLPWQQQWIRSEGSWACELSLPRHGCAEQTSAVANCVTSAAAAAAAAFSLQPFSPSPHSFLLISGFYLAGLLFSWYPPFTALQQTHLLMFSKEAVCPNSLLPYSPTYSVYFSSVLPCWSMNVCGVYIFYLFIYFLNRASNDGICIGGSCWTCIGSLCSGPSLQKPAFINNVDVFEEEMCGVHLFFSLLPLAHPPSPQLSTHTLQYQVSPPVFAHRGADDWI